MPPDGGDAAAGAKDTKSESEAEGAKPMDVDGEPPASTRLLAVYCDFPEDEPEFNGPDHSCLEPMQSRADTQVVILKSPTLEEFAAKLEAYRPTWLYINGPCIGGADLTKATLGPIQFAGKAATSGDLLSQLEDIPLELVYLDAKGQDKVAELLRMRGVPDVLFWPEEPGAMQAAQFAATLFSLLAHPAGRLVEAYAVALYTVQAHCGAKQPEGGLFTPSMPDLLSASTYVSEDGGGVTLPDTAAVPPPHIDGLDLSKGPEHAVDGWSDVRLLAPRAEVRLVLAGVGNMLDASRLSFLGEALRALLAMEVRGATLVSTNNISRPPSHVPSGCGAARCHLRSASGAAFSVVLAAPKPLLKRAPLVEYALRTTLVADALTLQFRLPPAGLPPPMSRRDRKVLGGVPCVDTLAVSSVWVVHLLRLLAQDPKYRGLVCTGIAGVGSATTTPSASTPDVSRWCAIVAGVKPAQLPPEPESAAGRGSTMAHSSGPSTNPFAVPADPPLPLHTCKRAPMGEVTEEDFVTDLIAFLQQRKGRFIDRARFPEAVLNGSALDLFALYREVVARGGFRMGNAINWKGMVFANMRNWTANNRQTGVGNSLKKHYANYLWEYEQAHPHDVVGERCAICGFAEGAGTDWLQCNSCNAFNHLACDKREALGTASDYGLDGAKAYHCPKCGPPTERVKGEVEDAMATAVAAAPAPAPRSRSGGGSGKARAPKGSSGKGSSKKRRRKQESSEEESEPEDEDDVVEEEEDEPEDEGEDTS